MNIARLNGSTRAARINTERHLPGLERTYASLITQAAREAATALTASAQTRQMIAATSVPDWQIPPEGSLFARS